ncbi:hypothetical protein LTR85_003015 [Meristemomyces frigidus]|nr:hypothetical protein LTR85_003015 [Meristemomyces frigidus]
MYFSDTTSKTAVSKMATDEDTATCGVTFLKPLAAHLGARITKPKRQKSSSPAAFPESTNASVPSFAGGNKLCQVDSTAQSYKLPSPSDLAPRRSPALSDNRLCQVDSTAQSYKLPSPSDIAPRRDSAISGLGGLQAEVDNEHFRRQISEAWQRDRDLGWDILPGDEEGEEGSSMPATPNLKAQEDDLESVDSFDALGSAPDTEWYSAMSEMSERASASSGTTPEAWWSAASGASQTMDALSEAWWSQSSLPTQSAYARTTRVSQSQHIPVGEPVDLPSQGILVQPVSARFGRVAAHPVMLSVQQLEQVAIPCQAVFECGSDEDTAWDEDAEWDEVE